MKEIQVTGIPGVDQVTAELAINLRKAGLGEDGAIAEAQRVRDVYRDAFGRLLGSEVIEGAGPDATCGCGYEITQYDGEWLHVLNPGLCGTDDHDAEPDGPVDYAGWEDENEDERQTALLSSLADFALQENEDER